MATALVVFAGYNPAGGLQAGLTPSWAQYVNALTGVATSGPAIAVTGAAGMYQTAVDTNSCGIIQLGGGAVPAYVFIPANNVATFACYSNPAGTPLAGLVGTLAWDSVIDTVTGLPPVVTPGFVDLGGGCYGLTSWASTYVGVVNSGVSSTPQQQALGPSTGVGPGPGNIILGPPAPAAGLVIPASTTIQFPVVDTNVAAWGDITVEITVKYPSGAVELAYSSSYGGWTPLYALGSLAPDLALSPAAGGSWLVTRLGGWPANPEMIVSLVDATGASAAAYWTWTLAVPAVLAPSIPPNAQTSSPYGSDCRTYAVLSDSTLGVDPYFQLVSDPNIVMSESVARILSMAPGTLLWAPSQGYDLLSLVNAQTSGDFSGVQSQVIQAVCRDPRIQSCGCLITPLGGGTYSVNVTAQGGTGPFSCVFLLSAAGITALSFS